MVWRKHSSRQDEYAAFAELIRGILANGPAEIAPVS